MTASHPARKPERPAVRSGRRPGRPLDPPRSLRASVAAAVLLGLALAACGTDDSDPVEEELRGEPSAELPVDPLEGIQLTIGMERLEYRPGEALPVTLQLSNRSATPRTLSFRSAQRFDLVLLTEAGEEVSRWSRDQSFAAVQGEEALPSDSDGPIWDAIWEAPADPGAYRLEAVVVAGEGELRMGVPIEVVDTP